METNQLILLLVLLELLVVSLIILIKVSFEQLKEKTDEYFVFLILIGIIITFLIPLILGILQLIL